MESTPNVTPVEKSKKLVALLITLLLFSVIGMATFGYLYYKEKVDNSALRNQLDLIDEGESSTPGEGGAVDSDGGAPDEEASGGEEEAVVEPSDVQVTKTFDCSGWVYADPAVKGPFMNIVYSDADSVEFSNETTACNGIQMKYKSAILYITYSHGEAYPVAFKDGVEVLNLKTSKVDGREYTLGRQKYVVSEPAQNGFPAGYWVNYVNIGTKTDCNAEVMGDPAVGYPCYIGANPFVTPAGEFNLYISKDTETDDILTIIKYFDEVAKNSSYE